MNTQILDFVRDANLTGKIVDVGSLNVNGAIKGVLPDAIGIDMREGKGVDQVMLAEDMDKHFSDLDAITCCDTLEHVENWRGAMEAIWRSLKADGVLILTLPKLTKGYHGYPFDYWRWSMQQVKQIFRDQKIEREHGNLGVSFGVQVRKQTDSINLSVEPSPIDSGVKPRREAREKRRKSQQGGGR